MKSAPGIGAGSESRNRLKIHWNLLHNQIDRITNLPIANIPETTVGLGFGLDRPFHRRGGTSGNMGAFIRRRKDFPDDLMELVI